MHYIFFSKCTCPTFFCCRYEQLMLKFSTAFDTIEKAITLLEYKTTKKPEEDSEDSK